jgi:hypothetical protein
MQYIGKYMCNGDFCPCAPTVSPDNYGTRADEFKLLDTTGRVLRFYEDCYLPVLMSDTGYLGQYSMNKTGFTDEILYMLEEFEVEYNCAGLCETQLFFFFQSAKNGPPIKNCRQEIIKYYYE